MIDFFLCLTSATLGLRHGLDLDHVLAITDLICSRGSSFSTTGPVNMKTEKTASYKLAVFYCIGHAIVVSAFGLAALSFRTLLPVWLDGVMETIVGLTLIGLGVCMLYSATEAIRTPKTIPTSRGMAVLSTISTLLRKADSVATNNSEKEPAKSPLVCDWRCALSIGAIHGIGAETSTQVLLLAALPGSGGSFTGLLMLTSFILGMLGSTMGLAFMVSEGYYLVLVKKVHLALLSISLSIVSIITGCLFVSGKTHLLPFSGGHAELTN